MQEYVTDAIVLRKDPLGDQDGRYALFTKRFGRIVAKAKSSRKITSKLAPHLEPGMVAKVRFIETKGIQLIDALKAGNVALPVAQLHALNQLIPDADPEPALWELLTSDAFSWPRALAILGWDPQGAECAICGEAHPKYFSIARQEFYCRAHASKASKDGLLFIDAVQSELHLGKQG
ncbi:MAG TPA: recombination protein O N-terminal domain-containing protein [Candidatus Paceibacterota bacterium]|nr:recombination protein O N-terminal domain-containing protein [Candidatus Paceibacterota bacterium]